MIDVNELVESIAPKDEGTNFKLGVVSELFLNDNAKITFDGESEASEKLYPYLSSYTPKAGDRVLLAAVSGSYVILGKVLHNVEPEDGGKFVTINVSGQATVGSLYSYGLVRAGTLNVAQNTTLNAATAQSLEIAGSTQLKGNVGFYGIYPASRQTAYYAANDTNATLRTRLNELIQKLNTIGIIRASN